MQDRYTGDLGDFSKLGILRALQAEGLSIGLNWYLVPDETHNGDGRHIKYLNREKYKDCDEQLWLELKSIVENNHREARYMKTYYVHASSLKDWTLQERQKPKENPSAMSGIKELFPHLMEMTSYV